ncbi:Cyclin- protein fam58a [Dermatophagoides farinae]|uniref:Cyclin- protein fam58a n=1 Tax=Dermatophagoides farinae TaxID=6954 RepID=A0A922L6D0_DERFA|nr:Cyclin- protein fam58a [Dermatophagoides farinae]
MEKLKFNVKQAIDLLIKSAIHLQLHTDSICTACRYIHHFNEFLEENPSTDEDTKYDLGVVVTASLYIATKTKENHTPLSELISSVHYHLKFIGDNDQIDYKTYQLLPKDFDYWKLRDSVTYFELLMLRILRFDLIIDLPHKYLIFYLKTLSNWINDNENIEKIFTFSWSMLNDYCCYHPHSLKWPAHHIALATIELAMEILCPEMKKILQPTSSCKDDRPSSSNEKIKSKHNLWYMNFDQKLKHDMVSQIINQMQEINSNDDIKMKNFEQQ